MADKHRYLVIGAHADDCESAGGIALKLKALGHDVQFLVATNGCSGHHLQMGGALVQRRLRESERVSALTGIPYHMLDLPDGGLTTGLPERNLMMRAIRDIHPDVIITHRPWDYHPDHRNTSLLVQDCAYLLMVPNVSPATPSMKRMPAIFYMQDRFRKPIPFSPDLVFDISEQWEMKLRMYHQYDSQMYEWLPWVDGLDMTTIPEGDEARFEWLKNTRFGTRGEGYADQFRQELTAKYGQAGNHVRHAEALECCEYGRRPSKEELDTLFPF